MTRDYYEILEIKETATLEDIKRSYKSLAKKYHPDLNNGDSKKFLEITEAYKYLVKNYISDDEEESSRYFSQYFNELFKTMQSSGAVSEKKIKLDISLQEALSGLKKDLTILFDIPCGCSYFTRKKCLKCNGVGYITEKVSKEFIFSGITHQNQVFNYTNFYKNINLQVTLNILPEGSFKIRGYDVLSVEDLDIFKAMIGGEIKIKTLFGEKSIQVCKGYIADFTKVIDGWGLTPQGRQIVKFKIFMPNDLTEQQWNLLNILAYEKNEHKNKDQ